MECYLCNKQATHNVMYWVEEDAYVYEIDENYCSEHLALLKQWDERYLICISLIEDITTELVSDK